MKSNSEDTRRPATRLPIGISMGCPASIGPEIILKYHLTDRAKLDTPIVVIGDIGVLKKCSQALGLNLEIRSWKPGILADSEVVNVYPESKINIAHFSFGLPTPETSSAMAAYVERAISLSLEKKIAALVTCPISKSALHQAGYDFPGHTEMLAARTDTKRVAMMLAGSSLRVVPATIHCPLSEAIQQLRFDDLVDLIELVAGCLRSDFSIDVPRIGVAGLNPHAGENGLFGHEEETIIGPAVAEAGRRCLATAEISGPYPPDTIFYNARAGRFDCVVAMYHDQGLIPFKLLHFDDGVNITLGLPIIRTSVDHGTAYDIAGQGLARHSSLSSAVTLAEMMVTHRNRAT